MATKKQPESANGKTKVLVVDDHSVIRQGLARLIEMQPDLVVCGEAANAAESLEAIKTLSPDIAIVDILLDRDISGLELIKQIRTNHFQLPVLVLSMYDETVFAERVVRAGAKGYVMKTEPPEVIIVAIRRILEGKIYLSDNMSTRMLSSFVKGRGEPAEFSVSRLTDRELEILELIGRGLGTSKIAEKLFLSVKTVETHRTHIKQKLQLGDGSRLLQYAIEWVQIESVF